MQELHVLLLVVLEVLVLLQAVALQGLPALGMHRYLILSSCTTLLLPWRCHPTLLRLGGRRRGGVLLL